MSSYILGITNKMQLFIHFFYQLQMYLNFSQGTSHLLIARWWRIFVSWGGGSRRVCSGNRGEVSRHQQEIVYKLENTY